MNKYDKQEDDLLNSGNCWIADYSEGSDNILLANGVTFRQNKYWIHETTKERITHEEFEKRHKRDVPEGKAIESHSFKVFDLSKIDNNETEGKNIRGTVSSSVFTVKGDEINKYIMGHDPYKNEGDGSLGVD